MSIAEKAALASSKAFAEELDALPDEERAAVTPDDSWHSQWFFNDPNDRLGRTFMGRQIAHDDNGNEIDVPVVHLNRPAVPFSAAQMIQGIPASARNDSIADAIPMAKVQGDGTLIPTGKFNDTDVQVGLGMVGELRAAKEAHILPHLAHASLAHISQPGMESATRLEQDS